LLNQCPYPHDLKQFAHSVGVVARSALPAAQRNPSGVSAASIRCSISIGVRMIGPPYRGRIATNETQSHQMHEKERIRSHQGAAVSRIGGSYRPAAFVSTTPMSRRSVLPSKSIRSAAA